MIDFLKELGLMCLCMLASMVVCGIIMGFAQVFFHYEFSEFRQGFWVASLGWIFFFSIIKKNGRTD